MKAFIQTIGIFIIGALIIVSTKWLVTKFSEPQIIEVVFNLRAIPYLPALPY